MKIKKQTDVKDCGPLVIQALHHNFYSKWIRLNELKMNAEYGTKGLNIENLSKLGQRYGIDLEAFEASIDDIKNTRGEDLVALVDSDGMNHYVVIKSINGRVFVSDSIKGEYELGYIEFAKIFKNIILTIRKTDYIHEDIDITHPMKYLAKNWSLILWISFTLVISITFTFTSSLFMKIILDKVLPGKLERTLTIMVLAFSFLAILRAGNNLLRSYLIKKLSIQIESDLTFSYFDKLNKASYKDISKLTINDNLRRIGIIAHVSGFMANSFFVLFNEASMLIVATSLLMWISPQLFAISLGAAGALCLITIGFRVLTRTKYDDLIQNQMSLFNSFVDSVNQSKELKNSHVREFNRKIFSGRFVKSKTNEFEIWSFNTLQGFIESIIEYLVPIVLVYIGVKDIFASKLSIGSLMMFVSIFNSFVSPIKDLCEFFLRYPQMQKNINLLSFIINLEDEEINEKGMDLQKIDSIELKNFSCGYDKTVFATEYFKISKNIRLIGKNGSGKSTLLNSISTILNSKGHISFNGFEKEYYNLDLLRKKMIHISPSTYIPNVSVLEYATLNDKEATKRLFENAEKYNLFGLMNSLGLSLETPLINNGQNISSGQRQVVTLLRLFSFKYELIILDEAFENIDPNKLKGIKKAIIHLQKALFIEVSHSGKYISNGKEVDIEKINSHS